MSLMYEELDSRPTPLGDLMLRRRRLIQLGGLDIYEVKLGEYFLMTSLFHEAEVQLSKLSLGVFGLWADGFPEDSFTKLLGMVFKNADSHTIEFDNPLTRGSSEGTVYVARRH
ncbi:MAG: hypothetical protein HOK24_22795 [Desulfobacula sp.]|jgi:hypothetical protein|uniref:hypothetical protein n=1 Tax=Desulfobacula sp. TaxID=2593537 RepID=UPI002A15DCD6|nr:hypothetical protein [Desulfobacula sp.]MBT5973965.1 hypothetical protein [Desulfobacula sp.]MBT7795091.1 hypothetical protein [Desulfobacula sp.]